MTLLISKSGSNGTTSYAWDFENRLISVTLPGSGGTVTFKYDPFGRRIQKSGPAGTANFLYDGANIVADLDVSGTVLARYTQGSGIDEPLASVTGQGAAFFEADGLGSVTSLSGASGVTDTYTFKPFGITTANGSNPNRFRFTGREWDQETGLYYYRARYYDPSTGRFLSEDPMKFAAGLNFYSYVHDNPIDLIDPLGLCPDPDRCDVPAHPQNASVDQNIWDSYFRALDPTWWSEYGSRITDKGDWDYAKQGYDDFGNFNFGATAAAMGLPDSLILRGAGGYKLWKYHKKHRFDPFGRPWDLGPSSYGNEPEKQRMVQQGIDYYRNGCMQPPGNGEPLGGSYDTPLVTD